METGEKHFDRLKSLSKALNELTEELNSLLDEAIVKEPLDEKLIHTLKPLRGIIWYLYLSICGWFLFLFVSFIWTLYQFSIWQDSQVPMVQLHLRILLPSILIGVTIFFLTYSLKAITALSEFRKFLIEFKAERKSRIESAMQSGKLEKVRELFLTDPTIIDAINTKRNTLIHKATSSGRLELLEFLLSYGFPASPRDESNSTPLHIAASRGFKEIVQILLSYGADINEKDANARTPLHLAAKNGHKEVVEFLISKNADINSRDIFKDTPLSSILHNQLSPEIAELSLLLIHLGSEVNTKNNESQTPLHLAAEQGYHKTVKLLIAKGAEINIKDNAGCTPLHRAVQRGNIPVMETLLSNGADINAQTGIVESSIFSAWTALHFAVSRGYYGVVELLLRKGADVNLKTHEKSIPFGGYTPLRIALESWKDDDEHQIYKDIADLLSSHGGIQ